MADQDFIPYGRQEIDEDDVAAVVEVLRSDFLTQGPAVERFEQALAERVGASHAVAVANGTAALHLAALALGLGPGDAWITSPLTFVATANAARYVGATPVFADVDETGCLDPDTLIPEKITAAKAVARMLKSKPMPRVLAGVDLAGQPADWSGLLEAAQECGLKTIDDGCHALGASWTDAQGNVRLVGQDGGADMTVFSFHPVKHITTAEGGAICTADPELAARLRLLRSHGITKTGLERPELASDPWYYEQQALGFNYRLSDLQAALGLTQLKKLDRFLERRRALAVRYDEQLASFRRVRPLGRRPGVEHAYHLYIVRIDFASAGLSRAEVMGRLLQAGVGSQVHYIPVHLQPDFRRNVGTRPGDCPKAEALYQEILSLPLFPGLTEAAQDRVVAALADILE